MLLAIERGAPEGERWKEWRNITEQIRKLAESERRRHVESHQMATIEEIMAATGAIVEILKRHVTDERLMRAISKDIDNLCDSSGFGD